MINSTSSTDRANFPEPVKAAGQVSARQHAPRSDQLSTENATHLREALSRQPEIRPEVVERARALAADSNYPSHPILRHVAATILQAPDLSENVS